MSTSWAETIGTPSPQGAITVTVPPPQEYSTRVDEETTNLIYVGEALPGSSETDPVWRIQKVVTTGSGAGSTAQIYWAGGTTDFTSIWANRLLLTYS